MPDLPCGGQDYEKQDQDGQPGNAAHLPAGLKLVGADLRDSPLQRLFAFSITGLTNTVGLKVNQLVDREDAPAIGTAQLFQALAGALLGVRALPAPIPA